MQHFNVTRFLLFLQMAAGRVIFLHESCIRCLLHSVTLVNSFEGIVIGVQAIWKPYSAAKTDGVFNLVLVVAL